MRRMWHSLAVALGLLLPAGCGDHGTFVDSLQLQEVFGRAAGLFEPIDLQAPPGDSRLFIAERVGRIRVVQGGVLLPALFLDIQSRVFPCVGECGLLSFTFHPQFASGQPFVFVHFVEKNATNGDIVVERYRVLSTDPNALETPGTEVIRIPHPDATNHYGGRIAFGPDGMLYLSTGDGGGGFDQFNNSQNTATRLGKLLRLDVSTLPYTIPSDNPIWPGATQPSEIWAIGLRNPFRYAFDAPTGRLYIGDVGQAEREEIDVVAAVAPGLNYGWSLMEGTQCLATNPCSTAGLTLPVYEYDHGQGCAIIGGYVYRGAAIPELTGSYVFSDLCSGWLRSLLVANGAVTVLEAPNVNVGTPPLSFGQDGFGELYVLTSDNRVLQVVRP